MTTVTSRWGSLTESDPRGSRRAYWRAQVAAHEGSGLSGSAADGACIKHAHLLALDVCPGGQDGAAPGFVPFRLAPARA